MRCFENFVHSWRLCRTVEDRGKPMSRCGWISAFTSGDHVSREAVFIRRCDQLRQHRWPFLAVNVDPGVIDTDMQAVIRAAPPEDFPDVQRFIRRKEEGGLCAPHDVALRVLRILSSPDLSPGGRYDVADFGEGDGAGG